VITASAVGCGLLSKLVDTDHYHGRIVTSLKIWNMKKEEGFLLKLSWESLPLFVK
jgi:hypothetical protein